MEERKEKYFGDYERLEVKKIREKDPSLPAAPRPTLLDKIGLPNNPNSLSRSGRTINQGFKVLRKVGTDLDGIIQHDAVMMKDYRWNQEKEVLLKQ